MRIQIYAVGKERFSPLHELINEYTKRLHWKLEIKEITDCDIDKYLDGDAPIIMLDERAAECSSKAFAKHIETLQTQGQSTLRFMIGGADGFTDTQREKAHFLLSFGKQTWPHKLVRVMLVEQIYRAQQILSNHPYHRA